MFIHIDQSIKMSLNETTQKEGILVKNTAYHTQKSGKLKIIHIWQSNKKPHDYKQLLDNYKAL